MFRSSAQQLERCARLSLRTTASPAFRAARIPQIAPAAVLLHSRYKSTQPRRSNSRSSYRRTQPRRASSNKSNQEQENKDNSNDGGESPQQLQPPPGWVHLTKEQYAILEMFMDQMPAGTKRDAIAHVLKDVKIIGVPEEFRDVLQKYESGASPSLLDVMRVPKIALKMTQTLSEFNRMKQEAKDNDISSDEPFTSNRPGETPPPHQQDAEKQARPQKEQQPEEQQQEEKQQHQKQQGQQGQGQSQSQSSHGKKKETPPPPPPPKDKSSIGEMMTYAIGTMLLFPIVSSVISGDSSREITWQELRKNFLDKGLVEKLVVERDRVRVELNREAVRSVYPDSQAANTSFYYYFTIGSVESFERKLEDAQKELGIPASERIPVSYATESKAGAYLVAFGPTILLVGLLYLVSKRAGGGVGGSSGMFGFGKSKAKMFNHDSLVKVKFSDVAGMDEAKVEIMEFVSFLKSPERFQRLGAKIPRGAILSGPPGTGKTLLAKATAGESQVPFYSVSGSEFVEMFVGVGASRVRDLFATARKNAPCIIFIDEIDAVGRSRSEGGGFRGGGNDEREATLNQILTEMDGFNTSEQVVVLAGTNRPDVLDKALMRPGRFDRHIHIDRPTMKGRQEIFKVHLAKIVTNEDLEYLVGRLAALTPGFAGADIANAVNEAALIAARANAPSVTMLHFEQAIERVIGGLERKSLVLGPEEKRTVAYHEAGHAICGWYFRWADPLLKVSIIPRGQGALGYAQYLPSSDAYLMSTNQLMDRMAMTLGGRVSEELHFPTVTTGASDDFKKVTRMATTMVTQWGMSEKLGPLHFENDQNQLHKPFAESTAQTIDAEVRRLVDEAYKQCKDLLTARKKEVGIVAEELLRKEVLSRDDLVRLLGPREWPEKEEFSKYFDGTAGKKGTAPPFPTESTDSPSDPQPAVMEKHDETDR